MSDKSIIGGVVVILLAVGGILYATSGGTPTVTPTSGGELVSTEAPKGALELAQCLSEKGVTFYGAFWCPHCQAQKALFGSAVTALPYVECSTPDQKDQTEVCKAKKITSYPTWIFADGSEVSGEQSFAELAAKSGCPDFTKGEASVATATQSTTGKATAVTP